MLARRGGSAAVALTAIVLAVLPARAVPAPSVLLRDKQASIQTGNPQPECEPGIEYIYCFQHDTEIEPSIAVNPNDPLNAVALFQSARLDSGGAGDNGYATTFDGGVTWTHGLLPKLTTEVGGPFGRASDAVVAFGPNDVVYANSLTLDPQNLTVNVSGDGGATWGDPVVLLPLSSPSVDKNWIVVDNSSASGHHLGRVYVVWDTGIGVWAAYSDDEGSTWETCGGAGCLVYGGQGIGAIPLVLPSGDLAVVFATDFAVLPPLHGEPVVEPIPGLSKFIVSLAPGAGLVPTGGPIVFLPPVTAGVWKGHVVAGQRAGEFLHAAAVDRASGRIYVTWADDRMRTDRRMDIVVASSADGIVWSPIRRISNAPVDVESWCPMIDVAEDGTVRVAYRQRVQEGTDVETFDKRVDTFFQESYDAGTTFTAPLKVSTPDSDMAYAAMSRAAAFLGDYDQLATAGGLTYIVRAEPVQVDPNEPRTYPPSYHHQRTWVAVLGPAPN